MKRATVGNRRPTCPKLWPVDFPPPGLLGNVLIQSAASDAARSSRAGFRAR